MKNARYSNRRFISVFLSMILVVGHLATSVSFANSLPNISHSSPKEAVSSGSPFEVTAVVTDDKQVESVVLHFRAGNDKKFIAGQMQPQGDNLFSFTLEKTDLIPPAVNYYIEATDSDGEKQFRGFEFDPLGFAVVAPVTGEPVVETKERKFHPALYVVGALLVVGLAVSFDDGGEDTETLVDLGITTGAQ